MSREKHFLFLLLPLALFILDQITKFWVSNTLSYFQTKLVIPNFLRITLLYNPGGAFGTNLLGARFYFWFALAVAVFIIVWYIFKFSGGMVFRIGILFILGGALGNLFDRLRIGKVIDWIEIGFRFGQRSVHWPVFNLADTYVTVGLILLLVSGFTEEIKQNKENQVEIKSTVAPDCADSSGEKNSTEADDSKGEFEDSKSP